MASDVKTIGASGPVSRREIRRLWSRWGRTVVRIRQSKKVIRTLPAAKYQRDYRALREACVAGGRQASGKEGSLYREMSAILEPWSDLSAFLEADAEILANLEARVGVIQRHLGGRPAGGGGGVRRVAIFFGLGLAVAAWFLFQPGAPSAGSGGDLLTSIHQGAYRLWYQATYRLEGANQLELSAVIVAVAIVVGLFTAMRTRSY